MKYIIRFLSFFVVGLAACWMLGWVEFTYLNIVPNEPLLHPRKARELQGTNMVMQDGQIIALWPKYPSERSTEEIYGDISNQLSRSDFQVDVDSKDGQLEIYVRKHRKFRDYAPPFTIPLIRQTVGKNRRELLAYGAYVQTNVQPESSTNASQPIPTVTNGTQSAIGLH
jgi:hypothetical protein